MQIVKIYENLQKTKKRQKPLFYAFTRLLGLYLRYQLRYKIQMVGRTQRVFYAVADALERIAAGFAVKMAVYHLLHAVLLEYLRKAAWRPFLVEWSMTMMRLPCFAPDSDSWRRITSLSYIFWSVSGSKPELPGHIQPREPAIVTEPNSTVSFCSAYMQQGSISLTFEIELHQ